MTAHPTTAPRCPDCSAVGVDRNLIHDATCPLGVALDTMMDEDRDWFAARPFATGRHRPLTAAERADFRMFGYWEAAYWTHVQVIQVAPGLRWRHPYGGGLVGPYSTKQVEQTLAPARGGVA